MRVLIPGLEFPDSFVDNVKVTLEDMGHQVLTVGTGREGRATLVSQAVRAVRERVFGSVPGPYDRRLLKVAKRWRPDLFLALTWDVHPEVLCDMGAVTRRILWWGDPPANSVRFGIVNPHWDHVFIKDPDAVRKLRLIAQSASLLHEAMNPRWHRRVGDARGGDVVIAGNSYAYRQVVVAMLRSAGYSVRLHGPVPPRWAMRDTVECWTGRYVAREDKSRAFGEALACLNTFSLAEGNSLNCRAFEIAGAGGLQVIEYRPIISDCFEPGREVLAFETREELFEILARARREPVEMEKVRDAGHRRALAEHTYEHRLKVILSLLT